MIERLLAVLAAADLEPDPRELRDALWLAGHIAITERTHRAVPSPQEPFATSQPALPPPTAAAAEPAQEPAAAPAEATTGAELYAAGSWGGGSGYLRAMEARSPAVPALRHQLLLARALKPFKRRVPSRTSFVVDEAATAARVAEEGIWLPVLRPAPARWLDLALVVDTSPSMVVWRRTLAELRTLVERLGAFRIVRVLAVDASTDPSKPLTVRPGSLTGGPTIGLDREPDTLIDPSRRQVILVVTDAVSGAWRDGRMDALLRRWGAATPVAVATVLPQRMWAGTGIRAVPAQLHALTPGMANGILRARARSVRGAATGAVPIPVMELSARWLGQWADVVAGAPDWRNAALLTSPAAVAAPSPASPLGGSAAEMVRRFRTAVSPTAFQLACYLSAAWLNLPVMRLVQRVMLPESDTSHLAEVFLGGLLRAVPTRDGMDPEIVQYDFLPQVRDELNDYLLRDEMLDVLRETSQFVAERFGQPLDFAALLADPEGTPLPALAGEGGPPLAYVAATVLAKLGGRYRSLANRLATAGPAAPGGLTPSSIDVSTPPSPATYDAEPGAAGRVPKEVGNLSDPVGTGVMQAEAPDAGSPDVPADEQTDRALKALAEMPSFETITRALEKANDLNGLAGGIATVQGGTDDLTNDILSMRVRFLWGSSPAAPEPSLLLQAVGEEDMYLLAHPELQDLSQRINNNDHMYSEIAWTAGDRAEDVGARLIEGIRLQGVFQNDAILDWGRTLTELARTLGVVVASRRRATSWRLTAPLFELVGSDWAITKAGVEHRQESGVLFYPEQFPSWYPGGYADGIDELGEEAWRPPELPVGLPRPDERLWRRAAAYLPLRDVPTTPTGWSPVKAAGRVPEEVGNLDEARLAQFRRAESSGQPAREDTEPDGVGDAARAARRLASCVSVRVEWPDAEVCRVDRIPDSERQRWWTVYVTNAGAEPISDVEGSTNAPVNGDVSFRVNEVPPGERRWYNLRLSLESGIDLGWPPPTRIEFTVVERRFRLADGTLEEQLRDSSFVRVRFGVSESRELAEQLKVWIGRPDEEVRKVDGLSADENWWVVYLANRGDRPVHRVRVIVSGESRRPWQIKLPPVEPGRPRWWVLRPDSGFGYDPQMPRVQAEFDALGYRWRRTGDELGRVSGEEPPAGTGAPVDDPRIRYRIRAAGAHSVGLRIAVAGPFTVGREAEFSRSVTQFAAEHRVSGRVVAGESSDTASSLAELISLPTPFVSGSASTDDLVEWVRSAAASAADLIVLDYGSPDPVPVLSELVDRLTREGRLVIASGGNSKKPAYPAWIPDALAVGALEADGQAAAYSPFFVTDHKPDIYVPKRPEGSAAASMVTAPDMEGTTFACLYAAAAAIAVWASDRGLPGRDVRDILLETAATFTAGGDTTARRLDVAAALDRTRRQLIVDMLQWELLELGQLLAETGMLPEVAVPLLDDLVQRAQITKIVQDGVERFEDPDAPYLAYARLRQRPPGYDLTAQMQRVVVDRAKELAQRGRCSAAYVQVLWNSGHDGRRVVALGVIQARPELGTASIVVDGIRGSRSPFEQYQALVAAGAIVGQPREGERDQLRAALAEARADGTIPDGDRGRVADALLAQLEPGRPLPRASCPRPARGPASTARNLPVQAARWPSAAASSHQVPGLATFPWKAAIVAASCTARSGYPGKHRSASEVVGLEAGCS